MALYHVKDGGTLGKVVRFTRLCLRRTNTARCGSADVSLNDSCKQIADFRVKSGFKYENDYYFIKTKINEYQLCGKYQS
jgi:hypothetical protein